MPAKGYKLRQRGDTAQWNVPGLYSFLLNRVFVITVCQSLCVPSWIPHQVWLVGPEVQSLWCVSARQSICFSLRCRYHLILRDTNWHDGIKIVLLLHTPRVPRMYCWMKVHHNFWFPEWALLMVLTKRRRLTTMLMVWRPVLDSETFQPSATTDFEVLWRTFLFLDYHNPASLKDQAFVVRYETNLWGYSVNWPWTWLCNCFSQCKVWALI